MTNSPHCSISGVAPSVVSLWMGGDTPHHGGIVLAMQREQRKPPMNWVAREGSPGFEYNNTVLGMGGGISNICRRLDFVDEVWGIFLTMRWRVYFDTFNQRIKRIREFILDQEVYYFSPILRFVKTIRLWYNLVQEKLSQLFRNSQCFPNLSDNCISVSRPCMYEPR